MKLLVNVLEKPARFSVVQIICCMNFTIFKRIILSILFMIGWKNLSYSLEATLAFATGHV